MASTEGSFAHHPVQGYFPSSAIARHETNRGRPPRGPRPGGFAESRLSNSSGNLHLYFSVPLSRGFNLGPPPCQALDYGLLDRGDRSDVVQVETEYAQSFHQYTARRAARRVWRHSSGFAGGGHGVGQSPGRASPTDHVTATRANPRPGGGWLSVRGVSQALGRATARNAGDVPRRGSFATSTGSWARANQNRVKHGIVIGHVSSHRLTRCSSRA